MRVNIHGASAEEANCGHPTIISKRQGSAYRTACVTDIALWTGWQTWRMASSVVLPHKPQLELDHRRRDDSILRPGSVSTTFTTFFNSGWSSSGQYAIVPISSQDRTIPSVKSSPMARSKSWPGVLIVTDRLSPFTRISRGSSTTTSSSICFWCSSSIFRTRRRFKSRIDLFLTPALDDVDSTGRLRGVDVIRSGTYYRRKDHVESSECRSEGRTKRAGFHRIKRPRSEGETFGFQGQESCFVFLPEGRYAGLYERGLRVPRRNR